MVKATKNQVTLSCLVDKGVHSKFTMVARGMGLLSRVAVEQAMADWVRRHAAEVGLAPEKVAAGK